MSNRFSYVKYDDESVTTQNLFRHLFEQIEDLADKRLFHPAALRAKAILMTKLEEAYAWVGKAIRDEQRATRTVEEQPERKTD